MNAQEMNAIQPNFFDRFKEPDSEDEIPEDGLDPDERRMRKDEQAEARYNLEQWHKKHGL